MLSAIKHLFLCFIPVLKKNLQSKSVWFETKFPNPFVVRNERRECLESMNVGNFSSPRTDLFNKLCIFSICLLASTLTATPAKRLTLTCALTKFDKTLDRLEQKHGMLPAGEKQRLKQTAFDFLWTNTQQRSSTIPSDRVKKAERDLKGYFTHQFREKTIPKKLHAKNNKRNGHAAKPRRKRK